MTTTPNEALAAKQKEMLIVMTALSFIEESGLISRSQLSDAKKSLQALFIRTTGEETMLRKLVDILKVNRDLHAAFSDISKISSGISAGVELISKKLNYLKHYVDSLPLTPEENEQFFAPFLSFTLAFQKKITQFNHCMVDYLALRETEAKRSQEFLIAQEASERLKSRLSGSVASRSHGEVERSMKREVMSTFDYAGAYARLVAAQRESKQKARQINEILLDLKGMCQMAMNPDMRDSSGIGSMAAQQDHDIFLMFTRALRRFKRLQQIKEFIIEYFRLYQRAYGMFVLDFDHFNRAVETIANNPEEYFSAKQDDEDIRVKREKLKKIEGLIPFLERTHAIIREDVTLSFMRFSKHISEVISTRNAQWEHIGDPLLVAKVSAEADLTTRLQIG